MRNQAAIPIVLIGTLIVFAPLLEGGTTHAAVLVIRLSILFLLGAFLANGFQTGRLEVPALPIEYVTLAFVGLAILSTLLSPYSHPSRQWLLVLVSYVVFFYLLVSFIQRWEHISVLVTVIVAVGVGEAIWTIVQGTMWKITRPSGTFFNPNFLAGYLAVSWTILLSFLLHDHRIPSRVSILKGHLKGKTVWLVGVLAALCAILTAALLTQSRAGILLFLIATVFVVAVRFGFKVAVGCGAVIVIVGLLAPTPIRERLVLEHSQNPVTYARWQMWEAAIQQMIENPLGIGLGLYQYSYPRYAFPIEGQISRYGMVAQTPHNDYLQMGVEMGPAVILIFVCGLVVVGREAVRLLRQRLPRRRRSLLVGLCGGGVALLIHAALDSSMRESANALMLVLCIGLLFSACRLTSKDKSPVHVMPLRSRLTLGIVSAGLLLLVGFEVVRLGVAWSYFDSASRYATEGRATLAIEGLRKAVALDPGKALYHQGLGTIYAKMFSASGDEQAFQTARAEFQEAIIINPLDGRLWALMGQLHLSAAKTPGESSTAREQQSARLQAARQAYDRAVSLMPFVAAYRYEVARLCWMLGEKSEAEQHAKALEAFEPNFLPARVLLARLLLDSGRIEGANYQLHEIQQRQERFNRWQKNGLEQSFLDVDVTDLLAAVEERVAAG